jgi:8-oxo-dGTP pyrophosphatase MutT (NUDIX family)
VAGEARGAFAIQGTRLIYDNPWMQVREDAVKTASGADSIYGVVTPKNWALGVIPLLANGNVILVGQHRYPHDVFSWEIPEGGGRLDRDPLAEIQRELAEETGYQAARWTPLGPVHTSNSTIDESAYLWLAQDLSAGQAAPDGDEVLEVREMPLAQALAMAQDGRIFDAMSIIGLYRAAHLLHSEGALSWPSFAPPVDAEGALVKGRPKKRV